MKGRNKTLSEKGLKELERKRNISKFLHYSCLILGLFDYYFMFFAILFYLRYEKLDNFIYRRFN